MFRISRSCTRSWTRRQREGVVWPNWRGSFQPLRTRLRQPLLLHPRACTLPSLPRQISHTRGKSLGTARYNTSPRALTVWGTFPWAPTTPAPAAVDPALRQVRKAPCIQTHLISTHCHPTVEPERRMGEDPPPATADRLFLVPSWRRWAFNRTKSNQIVQIIITIKS